MVAGQSMVHKRTRYGGEEDKLCLVRGQPVVGMRTSNGGEEDKLWWV